MFVHGLQCCKEVGYITHAMIQMVLELFALPLYFLLTIMWFSLSTLLDDKQVPCHHVIR